MKKRGHKVPTLDKRPEMYPYLRLPLAAYNDLCEEGRVRYVDYLVWAGRNKLSDEQTEYVWMVIKFALTVVHKWRKQQYDKSSQPNSGKTTSPTSTPRAKS